VSGTGGASGRGGGASGRAGDAGEAGAGESGAAGTGGESGASGNAGGGEPGAERCGDANLDQGEKCDDGTNNGPGKACNAQCQPNVCGDGDKGPGEGCDNGAENGLELLRCAPDCSAIIEIKHFIVASKELTNSNLRPNPVATADATCPIGYKAFFAYGTNRRATTAPFKAQNSIDWVIRPYTYYYNDSENPLWLTDSVPLLGVRDGKFTALENRVSPVTAIILTGLNPDYTTLGTDNCQGWSSLQDSESKRYGLPPASDASFMYSSEDTNACGMNWISFYCVEQ
jgi:hypothetical protein